MTAQPIDALKRALVSVRRVETMPVMEYVWDRTNRVLVNEELLRAGERADGRHDGEERNGASGLLGTRRLAGRMANVIDSRRKVLHGYGTRSVPNRCRAYAAPAADYGPIPTLPAGRSWAATGQDAGSHMR